MIQAKEQNVMCNVVMEIPVLPELSLILHHPGGTYSLRNSADMNGIATGMITSPPSALGRTMTM